MGGPSQRVFTKAASSMPRKGTDGISRDVEARLSGRRLNSWMMPAHATGKIGSVCSFRLSRESIPCRRGTSGP
jgi:hypothetical protein